MAFQGLIEEFQPPEGIKYDAVVFNESLQHTDTPLESIDRYRGFLSEHGFIVISLFKNAKETANGPRLARFLAADCMKGKYSLIDQAEGISVSRNLVWRIFVFR